MHVCVCIKPYNMVTNTERAFLNHVYNFSHSTWHIKLEMHVFIKEQTQLTFPHLQLKDQKPQRSRWKACLQQGKSEAATRPEPMGTEH